MKQIRCAIYTRKSSEEGLEQSFNSLDAQREACEAYILSQKSEGWKALPTLYDDGGYSGGNMARPGLEKLLADVASGRVDVVVVYKVDRLTRSLADFAKIVEVLDRQGASFVSVTQAFNTTTSMGRLTLNVLLSFAQFEREVTGERIRDKIAASKAKGMWMGGCPPLGYDAKERTLVVNDAEAEHVRHIFSRYLSLKSVNSLASELEKSGIVSKSRTSSKGRITGGKPFSRGALFHLLRNRLYLGEIVHKAASYPGQHEGIVDRATFDRVQRQLKDNALVRTTRTSDTSPLAGLIYDAQGRRMSPVHARGRDGRKYRYYVQSGLQNGARAKGNEPFARVSASLVEEVVIDRMRLMSGRGEESWAGLVTFLKRVEIHSSVITMELVPPIKERWYERKPPEDQMEIGEDGAIRLTVPTLLKGRGGERIVRLPPGGARKPRYDKPLMAALKRAHRELESRSIAFSGRRVDLTESRGLGDPYLRRIAPLAFLAPDIQRSILEGRQPAGLTLKRLIETEMPLCWNEQRARFGF